MKLLHSGNGHSVLQIWNSALVSAILGKVSFSVIFHTKSGNSVMPHPIKNSAVDSTMLEFGAGGGIDLYNYHHILDYFTLPRNINYSETVK